MFYVCDFGNGEVPNVSMSPRSRPIPHIVYVSILIKLVIMPQLTRNSMEAATRNIIANTSYGQPVLSIPYLLSSSHVLAVPFSNVSSLLPANTIVNDVVQLLQGTLENLFQSTIDACLSSHRDDFTHQGEKAST